MTEEPALALDSARIAGEPGIAADKPMAGNDDGHGIVSEGASDRARRPRGVYGARQLAVACRSPPGYRPRRGVDPLGKAADAGEVEDHRGKIDDAARAVAPQRADEAAN